MLPTVDALSVLITASLREALLKIDKNAQSVVFVIKEDSTLIGIITDGDARRALLAGVSLDSKVTDVMTKKFTSVHFQTPEEEILKLLSTRIRHIPLVDDAGKLVDYACHYRTRSIPVMEPSLRGNELAYVTDCINTKWISSAGKYITQFEQMFADTCGGGYAVAVSNGTVALHLALVTLGIGPGDAVLVPDLTFAASINTVITAGAQPVLVDVNPDTWCMEIEDIRAAMTPNTRAIMPVHLYGQPTQMTEIMKFAARYGLVVIEDAAEAFGSRHQGISVGRFGEVGSFSFYGNKMISTGEGGMLLFRDEKVAEYAKVLRDHGMDKQRRYWHNQVGFNYRMTNMQAAIGVAQLERFEQILSRKLEIARRYTDHLSQIPGITLPPVTKGDINVNWLYTIVLDEQIFGLRDDLIRRLAQNGIDSRPVFYPLHDMPPYSQYATSPAGYSVSSKISASGISLPSSVELTDDQIELVCSTLARLANMRDLLSAQQLAVGEF